MARVRVSINTLCLQLEHLRGKECRRKVFKGFLSQDDIRERAMAVG